MTTATRNICLHVLIVFVTAFGGIFATADVAGKSASAVGALAQAAAMAGVIAVAHYLSDLIPNSTVVAQSKADKAIKKATK